MPLTPTQPNRLAPTEPTLSADVVKRQAQGHWLSIIQILLPELQPALIKPGRHVPCPVHGGRDGFRLFRDVNDTGGGICNTCGAKADGFEVLMWLRGWTFAQALSQVAMLIATESSSFTHTAPTTPLYSYADTQRQAKLNQCWQAAKPITHPDAEPARRYFRQRGLNAALIAYASLRYHPKLAYYDIDYCLVDYYPALLAAVANADGIVTLLRTYLTKDGYKAPVPEPKKLMPATSDKNVAGCAIRLGQPEQVLAVTEGLESALSVIEATGMVTWSLISASLMPSFIWPSQVNKLVIWADLDRPAVKTGCQAGIQAAEKLAQRARAAGLSVEIHIPALTLPEHAHSVDCLDVFNQYGPAAFTMPSGYFT